MSELEIQHNPNMPEMREGEHRSSKDRPSAESRGLLLLIAWTLAIMIVVAFLAVGDTYLSNAGVYLGADLHNGELSPADYESAVGRWRLAQLQFCGAWLLIWVAGALILRALSRRRRSPRGT